MYMNGLSFLDTYQPARRRELSDPQSQRLKNLGCEELDLLYERDPDSLEELVTSAVDSFGGGSRTIRQVLRLESELARELPDPRPDLVAALQGARWKRMDRYWAFDHQLKAEVRHLRTAFDDEERPLARRLWALSGDREKVREAVDFLAPGGDEDGYARLLAATHDVPQATRLYTHLEGGEVELMSSLVEAARGESDVLWADPIPAYEYCRDELGGDPREVGRYRDLLGKVRRVDLSLSLHRKLREDVPGVSYEERLATLEKLYEIATPKATAAGSFNEGDAWRSAGDLLELVARGPWRESLQTVERLAQALDRRPEGLGPDPAEIAKLFDTFTSRDSRERFFRIHEALDDDLIKAFNANRLRELVETPVEGTSLEERERTLMHLLTVDSALSATSDFKLLLDARAPDEGLEEAGRRLADMRGRFKFWMGGEDLFRQLGALEPPERTRQHQALMRLADAHLAAGRQPGEAKVDLALVVEKGAAAEFEQSATWLAACLRSVPGDGLGARQAREAFERIMASEPHERERMAVAFGAAALTGRPGSWATPSGSVLYQEDSVVVGDFELNLRL